MIAWTIISHQPRSPRRGFLLAAKDLGRAFEHEGCRVLAERLRAAAILWWLILLMVLKRPYCDRPDRSGFAGGLKLPQAASHLQRGQLWNYPHCLCVYNRRGGGFNYMKQKSEYRQRALAKDPMSVED